jgi:hypothetical protein
MSVGVVVLRSLSARPNTAAPSYLPVATESEFVRYWLPLATAHGLDVVRQFEPGVSLKSDDLPVAVDELDTMRDLVNEAPLDPPVAEHMLTRMADLRRLLTTVDGVDLEEVFIG